MGNAPTTILVLDDDPDIREVLALLLTQEGYYPLLAENGEEALDCLRAGTWTPDLIIVDECMPQMSGHAFIQQLEHENLRIMPVVLFSASNDVPRLCQELHAEGCIKKPFELDAVVSLLNELLNVVPAPQVV